MPHHFGQQLIYLRSYFELVIRELKLLRDLPGIELIRCHAFEFLVSRGELYGERMHLLLRVDTHQRADNRGVQAAARNTPTGTSALICKRTESDSSTSSLSMSAPLGWPAAQFDAGSSTGGPTGCRPVTPCSVPVVVSRNVLEDRSMVTPGTVQAYAARADRGAVAEPGWSQNCLDLRQKTRQPFGNGRYNGLIPRRSRATNVFCGSESHESRKQTCHSALSATLRPSTDTRTAAFPCRCANRKRTPFRREFLAELLVIVNLSIKDNPQVGSFIAHRLMTGMEKSIMDERRCAKPDEESANHSDPASSGPRWAMESFMRASSCAFRR